MTTHIDYHRLTLSMNNFIKSTLSNSLYLFFILFFIVPIIIYHQILSTNELKIISLGLIFLATTSSCILELLTPFDSQFRMFTKQFIFDSYFTFMQLPVVSYFVQLLDEIFKKKQIHLLDFLWPHQANPLLQTVSILLISELFYYCYHRLEHENNFLWKFHEYHHRFPTVYWNNSATFHIVDITVSTIIYFLPLLLFRVDDHVKYMFITITGVTGILIHVNFKHDTRLFNWVINTAELHRWHHQEKTMHTNYGKVLSLWDIVFKTRHKEDNLNILTKTIK